MYSRWLVIDPIRDFGLSFMGTKFLALILAIIVGAILYFTFLRKESSEELSGFKKVIFDFLTFKTFTIRKVLTFVYVILAGYLTIFGALYLFVSPLLGFSYLIVYNILARLGFELVMLFVSIKENLDIDDVDDVIIIDEDDIEFVDEDDEIDEMPENKTKKSKKVE